MASTENEGTGTGTGTVWVKTGYLHGERDPATGEPRPGTIPPGMYCEDAGTMTRLKEHPKMLAMAEGRMTAGGVGAMPPFFGIAGIRIVVATAEQANWFRAREAAGSVENH